RRRDDGIGPPLDRSDLDRRRRARANATRPGKEGRKGTGKGRKGTRTRRRGRRTRNATRRRGARKSGTSRPAAERRRRRRHRRTRRRQPRHAGRTRRRGMSATILSGRYEIGEKLGSGGMSTVHRATDLTLERTVAVKILAEHLSDDERFVARF